MSKFYYPQGSNSQLKKNIVTTCASDNAIGGTISSVLRYS